MHELCCHPFIYLLAANPWAVPLMLSCSSVKLANLHRHSYFFWSLSIFPMFMKHQQLRPGTLPNPTVLGTNYFFSRIWKHLDSTVSQHLPSYYCNKKDFYRIVNCKCVIFAFYPTNTRRPSRQRCSELGWKYITKLLPFTIWICGWLKTYTIIRIVFIPPVSSQLLTPNRTELQVLHVYVLCLTFQSHYSRYINTAGAQRYSAILMPGIYLNIYCLPSIILHGSSLSQSS